MDLKDFVVVRAELKRRKQNKLQGPSSPPPDFVLLAIVSVLISVLIMAAFIRG